MLVDYRSVGPAASPAPRRWRDIPVWNRFTAPQLVVMGLASIAPVVIASALTLAATGAISSEEARDAALAAGENPGMLIFGAMFLASPMQWWTGRSQVRVRKFLGIVFFLLALSNGAMFLWDEGAGELFSRPVVVAGSFALALAAPLFITSSHRSQRLLGMRRWRLLHKLTYLVAFALLVHVLLIPDPGPGMLMILVGFGCRIPAVRSRIQRRNPTRRIVGNSY